MPPCLRGVGVAGAFGAGVADLRRALAGERPRPAAVPLPAEGEIATIAVYRCDTGRLEDYIPKKAVRRIDHFSRLALLGAHLALEDAGALGEDRRGLGLVIASGYGAARTTFAFLDSFIDGGDQLSSPTQFANSVHNAAAAHIAIALGIQGPSLTVSQFELSVASALLAAMQWLEEGRVETLLFGAVDEYCDVLGYCRRRFFGDAGGGDLQPLALGRTTAVAGEGAAFFLLARDHSLSAPYGRITAVRCAAAPKTASQIPGDAVVFLGANGHPACGPAYARCLPAGRRVAAYAPLYGSLPTGQAFDLAIAALSRRDGRLFPSPVPAEGHPWREIVATEKLDRREICCLTAGSDAACGLILLGA